MPSPYVDPAIAEIAGRLLANVDQLAEELAGLISTEIEVYRGRVLVSRADLTDSLTQNLRHILGLLSGSPAGDLEAPRDIGRRRADQDVPLPEILRAYRLGFLFVWQNLLDAAREAGQPTMNALLATATTIWEQADEYSQAMTDSYRQSTSERLIADDRRRSGIVAALLEGSTTHRSVWEMAKLLDMPYEGSFLVLLTESTPDGSGLPHIEQRLLALGLRSAWRAQPEHEIGVISLGRRQPDEVVAIATDIASARVGVSPEYHRLDGTPRAVSFARVALETIPSGTSDVRQLEDTPMSELLIRDREATQRFVVRVLKNVLALPDDDRTTLLATAEAWLAANGSAAEAGRVLYCHENTVRHRIHRLEEHLGVSLDDPRSMADVNTALEAIRVFPELGNRVADPLPPT